MLKLSCTSDLHPPLLFILTQEQKSCSFSRTSSCLSIHVHKRSYSSSCRDHCLFIICMHRISPGFGSLSELGAMLLHPRFAVKEPFTFLATCCVAGVSLTDLWTCICFSFVFWGRVQVSLMHRLRVCSFFPVRDCVSLFRFLNCPGRTAVCLMW